MRFTSAKKRGGQSRCGEEWWGVGKLDGSVRVPRGVSRRRELVHRHAMVSTRAWARWHLEVVESLGLRDYSPTRIPVPLDYTKKQLRVNGGRDLPPALGSP